MQPSGNETTQAAAQAAMPMPQSLQSEPEHGERVWPTLRSSLIVTSIFSFFATAGATRTADRGAMAGAVYTTVPFPAMCSTTSPAPVTVTTPNPPWSSFPMWNFRLPLGILLLCAVDGSFAWAEPMVWYATPLTSICCWQWSCP